MEQQTAINWLREKLQETYDKEGKLPLAYTFSLLNKAEQMEKEQIIKSFNEGTFYSDEKINAEQYYNEVYGGQGSPDTNTSQNTENK